MLKKISIAVILCLVVAVAIGLIKRNDQNIERREAAYVNCAAEQRNKGATDEDVEKSCWWAWEI